MEEARAHGKEDPQGTEFLDEDSRQLNEIAGIFSRLSIACKSRSLYPAEHPNAKEAVNILHSTMANTLNGIPSITIQVDKDGLIYEDHSIGRGRESFKQLAFRIRSLNIQEIVFDAGLNQAEVEALVELMLCDPEVLDTDDGAETFLLTRGVHNIHVTESRAHRADGEDHEGGGGLTLEAAPEDDGLGAGAAKKGGDLDAGTAFVEITSALEVLEAELSGEPKDFLALLLNPEELARSLMQLAVDGENENLLGIEEHADAVFQFLKDASIQVNQRYAEFKIKCFRCMAESLLFLGTSLRNQLLLKHLIPKIDEEPVCIHLISHFNPQEIADILSNFFSGAPQLVSRSRGLLKSAGFKDRDIELAIDLLKNRLVDLGEVPPSIIAALENGLEEGSDDVLNAAFELPDLDEISASGAAYLPDEIEAIQGMYELDLSQETLLETTPMLLDLLGLGARLDNLDRIVALLQHNFWDLTGSAQLNLAAAILEKIKSVLGNNDPAIDPFRPDLVRLLQEATSDVVMHRIIQFSYDRRGEPPAVEGFKRYMSGLGEKGIVALIDSLGSEEDMSLRKYLVDVLSELGRDYVQVLGTYVDDPRWYLVRNIVVIMARLRIPDTLPYLRLTIIHPNEKVRAETIRCLGLMGSEEAANMLINNLQSMDETTRILCIRWLGRIEEPRAVNRLINMLEGKEAGAESLQVKKEIIQCLGEIKSPEAHYILKKYRNMHKLLNRSEWLEINKAAQEALDNLEGLYPHLKEKR
jgi:HEAT repeats